MSELGRRLEESMEKLLEVYQPFAQPGKDWIQGGEALQDLVWRRDEALLKGKPLSDEFKKLWAEWESAQPEQEERARIFQTRNKIVELGLQVSRLDTDIQSRLRKKADDLRRMAAESNQKSNAAKAYSGSR